MKTCSKCETPKEVGEFNKRAASPDGRQPICRQCQRAKDTVYSRDNSEKKSARATAWIKENPERFRATRKAYQKRKTQTDPNYRLARLLRSRLYNALQGRFKAGSAVDSLGCTVPELRDHLEKQFQPGMTWENYGKWHIDHAKALVTFDLTDAGQFAQACHYTNLRPLWATENIVLGGKLRHFKRVVPS